MFSTLVWIGYTETTDKKLHFSTPILPDFEHNTNKTFLDDVRKCTVYIYHYNKDFLTVNEEILLAQAALESGWGTSRFANEGNNLFGIRTYDLREPHMSPWKSQPKKWGVKVYKHKCDSVKHYIEILNNAEAYEEYRKMRAKGINDPFILLKTLDAYATDKNYFPKIKNIIKKIRAEYD
jgi:Bax protein